VKEVPMNAKLATALVTLAALLTVALPIPAADRGGYSMTVEMDGYARPEYSARGTVYVEAVRGREYAIRITNPLPCRVAVALSVDGLNSINASHTSASSASKWVLEPYETVTISGWQVNGAEARRFYFTGERESYGAYLGKTQDLGVIEAVFFREKSRPVARRIPPAPYTPGRDKGRQAPAPSGGTEYGIEGGAAGSSKDALRADSQKKENRTQQSAPLADEYAATGIGERTDHAVEWVNLDLEKNPSATVRVRYEFHDQLVKLGVLPKPCRPVSPLDRREGARGFDGAYCPDPNRPR
jgi:hypothetical protein